MKYFFEHILKRSLVFIVLIFAIALFGVYTFITLDQREIPETNINFVNITTPWGGGEQTSIEQNITNVIEEAILDVEGVENMTSVTQDNVSVITLELSDGADGNDVLTNVNNQVNSITSQFPEEAGTPMVMLFSNNLPLASYVFTAETYSELLDIRDTLEDLERSIREVDGVSEVDVQGFADEFYEIELDFDAMMENEVFPQDIIQAVDLVLTPVSLAQDEDGNNLRFTFNDETPKELLENLEVGGVLLSDIAEISKTRETLEDIIEYRQEPAIAFTVLLGTGENAPTVSEDVEAVVNDAVSEIDDNVEMSMIQSERQNIENIFVGLYISLGIALVAVVIGTFLGLSGAAAFVITLTIILSIFIGLIPIPLMGVDLNQISVIGLIIALGIIVDDAIVVNDNIERRYNLGDSKHDAIVIGTKEVAPSVIASTLAIVFTFSPLLLLSGANGQFIKALPAILITTMLVSTVLALLFVPAMRYKIGKNKVSDKPGLLGGLFKAGSNLYAFKILKNTIKKPLLSFIVVLVLCLLSFVLIRFTPFEFFPEADRDEVTIDVFYPEGATIESTHADVTALAAQLERELPHVEETIVFTGSGTNNLFGSSLSQSGSHTAQIILKIDKEIMSASETIDKYEKELQEAFGNDPLVFINTVIQGPPMNAPVIIEIYNEDLETLTSLTTQIEEDLNDEGIVTQSNLGQPIETVEYSLDYDALENIPLGVGEIKSQLNLYGSGFPINSVIEDGKELSINLRYQDGDIEDVDFLEETNREMLSQYIHHKNGSRFTEMKIYAEDSTFVDEYLEDLESSLDADTELVIGGDSADQTSFFIEISILFTVILILVYIIIAWEFNSLTLPLIIVFTILLGISGGIIGLFITQTPISFLAIMGMVSLSGIVVRNAVVLLDFIEFRREEGDMPIEEAIVDAGHARFRPIILTMITSIIALTPVAFSGDPLFVPLAITIIAGITFSTLLSLIATPSLYYLYYKIKYK